MHADSALSTSRPVNKSSAFFKKWQIQAQSAFATEWFDLLENDTYFTIEYKTPQVIILPIVDHESILMVKAKRPVIGASTWELPAGASEKGESMREGASRELLEETGIHVKLLDRFKALPSLVVSPNRMPMFPSVFQVNLSMEEYQKRIAHDKEVEVVSLISFSDIKQMIIDGEIFISLPMSIISRYLLAL